MRFSVSSETESRTVAARGPGAGDVGSWCLFSLPLLCFRFPISQKFLEYTPLSCVINTCSIHPRFSYAVTEESSCWDGS